MCYHGYMPNSTISENEATGTTKQKYKEIKKAFSSPVVPIFFTYIAPFPDYFFYITDQITRNVGDARFQSLVSETGDSIRSIIRATMEPGEDYQAWIQKYSHAPSFYNFQTDNRYIFRMNVALTFIFIALRETVKGWAIAAKKLPSYHEQKTTSPSESPFKENSPLYEELVTGTDIILKTSTLAPSSANGIEVNLLREFLQVCQRDFTRHTKTEEFLIMRVGLEKLILSSLPLFPNLIFSPINVIINLAIKYPGFPNLLYLLSEEFPTLVMQRMIFSGYMLTP